MSSCVLIPGQIVKEGLELLADDADHAALYSIIGHVDKEDEGWRLRKLVILLEKSKYHA